MAKGVRDYVIALCCEAPLSWRKGAVVMTVLINAVMIGGLYAGWHFEVYPAQYFIVGATVVAALDVLLIFPFKLWKANTDEIQRLKNLLSPRLGLSYAPHHSRTINGVRHTFVCALNKSNNDVSGVQVKVEEAKLKKEGSNSWEKTNLIARTNLSWCFLPNGHSQKYSTIQLPPGSEPLDFIVGPVSVVSTNGTQMPAFYFKMDPAHGTDSSCFTEKGVYRFILQVSGLDAGKPEQRVLFVDWNGADFGIRETEATQQG
jgi:hypothetical protein